MTRCPECGVPPGHTSNGRPKVFCSLTCKRAFHNRNYQRGFASAGLIQAWRASRGKSDVARWAYREMAALADLWNREDRAAGRMSMADYLEAKAKADWRAVDLISQNQRTGPVGFAITKRAAA